MCTPAQPLPWCGSHAEGVTASTLLSMQAIRLTLAPSFFTACP